MDNTSGAINRLIQEFNRLPGIGPKSAQRITYFLLRSPEGQPRQLAEAILSLKEEVKLCSRCFNVSGSDPCPLCASPERDPAQVCIVEQPQDVLAIEHAGVYRGLYHILHGALSPSEGVGADNIRIKELLGRLHGNPVQEIILATNTNLEGEQTSLYLSRIIAPLGIKVTRLARGLPYGTELEYADDVTLTHAFDGRQQV
ncbi:MAG: recombination protein RecR [Chloroflexi bacterium]|nr:recombination protein RecR [Chloroflexota bacterium]